jgi:asparagine synthase (glutamine-hydrolysing)
MKYARSCGAIKTFFYAAFIPPDFKLNEFEEKYILKKMASGLIPDEIVKREKFGFVAPGSPYLLIG